MSTTKRRLSLLLKVAVLVLVIFLGMAVQTADADAASYEAVKVSDLKIGSDDAVKTKLKSGGYIWVDRDFNGADHHDVYFQKEKGGDMYLILDYFDTVDYNDVIITNGQKFYYASKWYSDYGMPPKYTIHQLDLGNGRKDLKTVEGEAYLYGYTDSLTLAGYYNGNLYYSLSGSLEWDAPGRLYKLNVKTGKSSRVYKNFSAFSATGNGRYIYGYTMDAKTGEKDKFAIYDCKQKKKVRNISKAVYCAEVMNGKLYFYEDYNFETGKYAVYQSSLSGKDRKRILRVDEAGDMYKNRVYYGTEKKDGTMQYYYYNTKTGKKNKIDSSKYYSLLMLERAECGYK